MKEIRRQKFQPFFNLQQIASLGDFQHNWLGGKPGDYFRCAFCGYKFKIGDKYRIVYTDDIAEAPGNPTVCERCDGPDSDVRARWQRKWE